jgi:phage terminase large subunit
MIQQEYYCSFTAAIMGAYYAKEYDEAEKLGRFSSVPYDENAPVYTVWDLGISDAMSIGFFQLIGKEVHMIDFYETNNEGFKHYVKVLQERGYIYAKHFAPHDIKQRELMTGKTRIETAAELGIDFEEVPNIGIQNGIDQGRSLFKRVWIDKEKCKEFLKAIPQYTKEYDEEKKIFKDKPQHDWTSHSADMWRYAAVVIDEMQETFRETVKTYTPPNLYRGNKLLQYVKSKQWVDKQ